MTLKEKFGKLGYKEDKFRFFSNTEYGLVELFSDNETCYEDECIEEGYVGEIGESEDELLLVDEEFTGSEYEEYNDDDYDFEQYIDSDVEHGDDVQAEVHVELNMSDETPLLGSDGEVERNVWDSVKPPVEQNPPAPPTLWLGRTCLEEDPLINAQDLIQCPLEFEQPELKDVRGVEQHGQEQLRIKGHQQHQMHKAKGKKKALGLPKKRIIMKRKYYTRASLESKFTNTADDPVSID
nr:uncharacterized protein LOC109159120 [Ipomoea batatas]